MSDLSEAIVTFMHIHSAKYLEADRDKSIIMLEKDGLIVGEKCQSLDGIKSYALSESGTQLVSEMGELGIVISQAPPQN